jgi:hypothetical protein
MAVAIGVKVMKNIGALFSSGKKTGAWLLGDHFGDFKGLAGSKSELHGVLKLVHMYANHWCKGVAERMAENFEYIVGNIFYGA